MGKIVEFYHFKKLGQLNGNCAVQYGFFEMPSTQRPSACATIHEINKAKTSVYKWEHIKPKRTIRILNF